jgi:hypothetical protein
MSLLSLTEIKFSGVLKWTSIHCSARGRIVEATVKAMADRIPSPGRSQRTLDPLSISNLPA